MKNTFLMDHMQTATAVIDKEMKVVDANHAFVKRAPHNAHVIGNTCFNAAYRFNEPCSHKSSQACPAEESFKTKQPAVKIHHFWIANQAVVEEIMTTPIVEKNGDVNYVIIEFRDITELLGLTKGIITTCSYCKKIRDKKGKWITFEAYLQQYISIDVSHGICRDCKNDLFDKCR